ncbi:hypothetical protein [Bacillus cereus]|uniref:hypothetical protein n=1 Tax=Bacillus cereus TaxID=1396 RepID=UPI00027ABAE3|nr:hypothetical protein [Bacillus cereus]EJS74563.1 hypothetical protein ICY_03466 [Bacillus cereus BAG2X1-3]
MSYKVKFTKKQYERLNTLLDKVEKNDKFKKDSSTIKQVRERLESAKLIKQIRWWEELKNRIPVKDFKEKFTNFGFLSLYGIMALIVSFLVTGSWWDWIVLPTLLILAILDTLIFGKFVKVSEENSNKELYNSLRYANYKERFILMSASVLTLFSFLYLLFTPTELQDFFDGKQNDACIEKTDSTSALLTNLPNFATIFALAIAVFAVVDSNISNRINAHNSRLI